MRKHFSQPSYMKLRTSILSLLILLGGHLFAQEKSGKAFSSETFDVGVVVSDLRKAIHFYTNAIGFKEIKGFSVPADWTKDVGLTDGKKLDIRVLVLGDGSGATKLKLMEMPGRKLKRGDNKYITSQFGMRYTTIQVSDIDAALARLQRAGVAPDTKGGAVGLPEG